MKLKHAVKQMMAASAILLLSVAPRACAATYSVDRTDDAAVSACSATANDCTLRGAITKANAVASTDTISFSALFSSAQTITLDTELPHLTSGVTIAGPGADKLTVQPIYQDINLFTVDTGVSATLKSLTLSNAQNGILNNGTLTATNCTVSGNSASGITNNGTMTTNNCVVSDNYGFAISNNFGTLTATNCTIRNSDSGIYNGFDGNDTSATVKMTGCTVSGNLNYGIFNSSGMVSAAGGTTSANDIGICNYGAGTMKVTNSTVSSNYIGVYNRSTGTVNLTGCTVNSNGSYGIFTDNISTGGIVTVASCTVSGNTDFGIYNTSGSLNATECTVSGNDSGIVHESAGTMTVARCTVNGNTNYGITNVRPDGTEAITNCTISNNPTGISSSGKLTVTHCTLGGNSNGINIISGVATLKNTLVVGNLNNIAGTITDGGYNITSGTAAAAGLQVDGSGNPVLADNGGPTKTIKLLPGSPAIDKGKSFGVSTDQRGALRPSDDPTIASAAGGDNSDIGAFEATFVHSIAVSNPRSLPEGNVGSPGSVTFDITLNAASTQTVTVNYQTHDGINNPAIAGSDYVEKHGKITFAPGETLKRVTIAFIGDNTVELNETFFFDLKTPTNAIIADSRGVGQINNDDGPSLSIEDATTVDEGNEGTTPQTFIVRLSAASTHAVTVDWATASNTATTADYLAASGTLTFAPGQTSKVITIQVVGDTKAEPNENYKVNLSKPTYAFIADGQGVGTIRNDDATPQTFQDEPSQ